MNHAGPLAPHHRNAPQRVAAIIPAHNVGRIIASTVRSCRAIPGVDLIIVIDDASTDDTARAARHAGATVVSHTVMRGRASAIETGVKVAAMRDHSDWPPRLLLLLSGDLGESTVEATILVEAVMSGRADCAIATPPGAEAPPRTVSENLARASIRRATGWNARSPLKQERCLTREAITVSMPFASGTGLEAAMAIDILTAGLSVVELPCSFVHHDPHGHARTSRRSRNPAEVLLGVVKRRIVGRRMPRAQRTPITKQHPVGDPYPRAAYERLAVSDEA
ncbi:glycosyltransferase family 2 protein [Schaalia suimastitidis]|uniref:glycosyltransferase family 2 protein n=1 Tax=Schaalia suimastitidis TaxID=121163 RepID=UPI000422F10A|nr:glycosyltransferase [Schaalia suimastitidis]